MRILYASDLHGIKLRYEALRELTVEHRPELLVLGGDLFPDEDEISLDRAGRQQPLFAHGFLRDWLLRVTRECHGLQVALIFGNHDWLPTVAATEQLCAELPLHVLDGWTRQPAQSDAVAGSVIGGIRFIGLSHTPPTPWYVKDFERLDGGYRPDLFRRGYRWDAALQGARQAGDTADDVDPSTLEGLLARVTAPAGPWVFVAHAPPLQTHLDIKFGGDHIGSAAVRDFIQEQQPMLSLHGHIHESPALSGQIVDRLGRTICVNAGQERGRTRAALIDWTPAAAGEPKIELVTRP